MEERFAEFEAEFEAMADIAAREGADPELSEWPAANEISAEPPVLKRGGKGRPEIKRSLIVTFIGRGILHMADWKRSILLWVIVGLAACAPTTRPPPADQSVLRVGITPNAPPLIFKQGSEVVGLEADFAREFARFLGKSLRFVEVAWEDQIPALLAGRTDIIMSGISVTELRKVRIAFSNPYLTSGQMALIRSEDVTLFRSGYYSLIKRERIGVVKDTTGQFFVEQGRGYSKAEIVTFSTSREGVEALIDRKIDVFVHDAPIILYLASENETRGVTPDLFLLTREDLAWGIRKDDPELLKAANEFIGTLTDDGRLKSMAERWIPFLK